VYDRGYRYVKANRQTDNETNRQVDIQTDTLITIVRTPKVINDIGSWTGCT